MIFDPMYLLFVGPPMLLALWAQFRVKSAFAEASRIPNRHGLTGAAAARHVLDAGGLAAVRVEETPGSLSDHYDPRDRVLRLSPEVYSGRHMAAVGIAAHEAGHALQHAQGYAPLKLRSALVPMAATGTQLSMGIFMLGMLLSAVSRMGSLVILFGIFLFGLGVLFQIINLPVEFDASRRARVVLAETGIVAPVEMAPVSRVLNAAALTYVAATLGALMTLLYWISVLNRSRN